MTARRLALVRRLGRALPVILLLPLAAACARSRVSVEPEPVRPLPPPSRSVSTPESRLTAKSLIVPVRGVDAARLSDNFTARRGGRSHDAIDILAPRGTPVLAADDGRILRLSRSAAGGITIYQLDREERFVYYYAHLDRYRDGLKEGAAVRQGEVVGYVGTTGNAPPGMPHLHFQIMIYPGGGRYWDGEAVNPYPYLAPHGARR